MRFSAIQAFNFRNLSCCDVNVCAHDIFLVGENGQGKSSFLEAVYFCSYASSFRGALDRELVLTGEKECSVNAYIENSLYEKIQIIVANEKKTIVIDGKNSDRKSLLSAAPSIVFCYEDMRFINGTPEQRRWFFDQNLCIYDINYLEDMRRYKKILKTRNTILKELKENISNNIKLLDAIDPQFIECGLEITRKRAKEAEVFSMILNPLYEEVSGIKNIRVEYRPSWKTENAVEVLEDLEKKRTRDIMIGLSLSGPHRDSYCFTKDEDDFSKKASTGQRRLLALLIRAAQARRYNEKCGNKPILLLDDVLLELDGEKRVKFLSILPEYEQAFYTFLPEEQYGRYIKNDTLVYAIDNGRFMEK
ncbi:MAG: DNA replication and repair protein RecF [Spirochaetaceae bacterium]|jgi:DNA replication and repair protein RecF|nr:DNA replication and repair protein RecF [Spirochaetaceae bacterium]